MSTTSKRRPYVRPMAGWWKRDPFFVRYMAREVTSVAVLIYAIILTVGVVRLSQGEAAWNGWLAALQSLPSILLHLVLLVSFLIHVQSWFEIMPKTMAPIMVGGEKLAASTIRRGGYIVTTVVTVVVFLLARWWQS